VAASFPFRYAIGFKKTLKSGKKVLDLVVELVHKAQAHCASVLFVVV